MRGPGRATVRRQANDAEAAQRASAIEERGLATPSVAPDGTIERPFIEGTPLADRLAQGPMGLDAALEVAVGLLRTLRAVHAHGILHGAVKPSNVILTEDGPILVDVAGGQAADVRYLAPEQAGLLDHRTGPWSDLYGVGLVTYAAITGHPPFEGTMREVLRGHVSAPVPPLDVPQPVQAVLDRLLRKDPRERYHSAVGALADVEAVVAAPGRDLVVGAHDRRVALAAPCFLGRADERRRLGEALDSCWGGTPGLVFVSAESGGGKTSLLQAFAETARRSGARIFHGQGQDQAAPRPFGLFDGLAGGITPETADRLASALHDQADALADALPDVAGLLGFAGGDAGPEQHGHLRSLQAVGALLDHLGSADAPAVLLLDDAQWADNATRRALAQWWEHAHPGTHVLVVAAYRSEEVPPHDILRTIRPSTTLALAPLSAAQIADLLATMAGPLPGRAVAFVTRMAGGNPFLATAVLHGLVETGVLEPGREGWRADEGHLGMDEMTGAAGQAVADLLVRRLRALSSSTQRLLAAAAVLGKQFDAARAAQLAAVGGGFAGVVTEACRRHILIDEGDGRYAFTHDKLREAVLASLPEAERRALHLKVAQAARQADASFDIAFHFDAAGEPGRALPYALAAAASARARFSLETAEQYFAIAERGSRRTRGDHGMGSGKEADGQGRRSQRLAALLGLGETLILRGAYDEARPWLQEARSLCTGTLQRAEVDARLGELAFKQGDLTAATQAIERALRTLGHPAPPTRAGAAVRLPWELLVQTIHSVAPRRRRARASDADALAIRLYSRLAHINWFLRGVVPCAWAHLREMNLAERHAPDAATANAYAEHAVIMTTLPWTTRGLKYAQRAERISEDENALWHRGQALHFGGLCLLAAGRLQEALAGMDEAMRIFRRAGDLWQAGNAGYHVALILYRLGRVEQAAETARRMHEQADRIGDIQNTALCVEAWAKAAGTGLPAAVLEREVARCPRDDVQSWEAVQQAVGARLLADGRHAEAEASFRDAYRTARAGGLRSEYVAAIPAWVLTCLRRRIEGLAPWDRRGRRRLMAQAHVWLRRAAVQARRYPNNRPHVLREQAAFAILAGRTTSGRRLLEGSRDAARAAGQAGDVREADAEYQRLGGPLGWPGASTPAAGTASLALSDRFDALVDEGRGLVGAGTREAVVARLSAAALMLLRGTRADVVPMAEVPAALADAAARAAAAGGPAGVRPGPGRLADGTAVRSGLVAPVEAPDGMLCLYVVHDSVAGLFGPDEERLLAHLSALASVALENTARLDALTEARDRLAVQAGLLESQAEAMEDGLLVVDADGRMSSYNRRFREMWGLDRDVLAARDDARAIESVLHQLKERDAFVARIQHLYDHPEEAGRDVIELKDGRVFERHTAPVRAADGSLHGRIWHFRDVTAQRRSEAGLRHAYERLQEMDKMRARFINTAAHELNTPLTPIMMQVHLLGELEDEGLTARQKRCLAILRRNADRLSALVRDILEAARLDSGHLVVKRGPMDLAHTLHESVESFRESARRSGVAITVDAPASLPVEADEARMGQVLYNLLGNALRFTPEGGHIHVLARDGDPVVVQVRDTGPGMTAEQVQRLFQPFSQPVETPAGRPPGTGLGLYICHGIMQEHGGDLGAQSAGPGKGTTFIMRLPGHVQPGRPRVRRPARPRAGAASGSGARGAPQGPPGGAARTPGASDAAVDAGSGRHA